MGNHDAVSRLRRILLGVAAVLGIAGCAFLVAVLVGEGPVNAAAWATVLGTLVAMASAVAPIWRKITRPVPQKRGPPYLPTVRDIWRQTPHLLDRERELAQIAAFATSGDDYLWITGGAWAGQDGTCGRGSDHLIATRGGCRRIFPLSQEE